MLAYRHRTQSETLKALNKPAQGNALGLQAVNVAKPCKGETILDVPVMSNAIVTLVPPLTGLNGRVAVHRSRALPWPDMFDASGVGEIAVPNPTFTIIAITRIMLLGEKVGMREFF